MGRADLKAKIRLEGDASGATKAIKKTETRFQKLTKSIKTSALAQVAAIGGVVVAFRGLVRAIDAAITKANAQADAINALEGALAPLGNQVDSVSKSLQAQAAALQKVTKFGDETIIEAQAMLASFVKEEDAIKAATLATIDLAEAKKFDLVAAADLVSKTLGSSTNALTRYGIEVTGAVGSTERLTSLTENIAKVFGGRAAKAAETYSGKVKQLSDVFGDLQEKIGETITENDNVLESIDNLKEALIEVTPKVAAFAAALVAIATNSVKAASGLKWLLTEVRGYGDIGETIGSKITKTLKEQEERWGLLNKIIGLFSDKAENAAGWSKALASTLDETKARMKGFADETARAAEEAAKLRDKAKESATAMEKLGAALGLVTSAELAAEILEIEKALETAREATGGFGEEFERLEAIAAQEIGSIQNRIEGLRDGLGDMGEAAVGAGDNFDDLTRSVRDTNSALSDQARQARTTRGELIQLTAVAETLALAEARTALAATKAARKRITGTRGSRESSISDYGLSPFGTGGRVTVQPNGSLEPA